METEAFLFVGNRAQSEHIKQITFLKDGFQVDLKDGQTSHPYNEDGIYSFLKMFDLHEGVNEDDVI